MDATQRAREIGGLVGWFVLAFATAAIGAAASVGAGELYGALARPDWAPPASVFGPAWTALYALMAVAAWRVWRVGGFARARTALALFVVQLALNALWSWLFFGWQLGALAFADVVVLWIAIAATLAAFWRIDRLAGGLLVPYLAWVTFAAALNYTVWQLNPQVLG
ncbi:MAG TPA: TspO/MBR family protein [Xanthomonadales bacterium]|nr:TspO/MBR family protein [Xanthomonadales bacterium]